MTNCYHCGSSVGGLKVVEMRVIEDVKNPQGFPVKIHPLCAVEMNIPEEQLDDESMELIELASKLSLKSSEKYAPRWSPKMKAKQEDDMRNLVDVVEGENG